jgi:hypothetical protein
MAKLLTMKTLILTVEDLNHTTANDIIRKKITGDHINSFHFKPYLLDKILDHQLAVFMHNGEQKIIKILINQKNGNELRLRSKTIAGGPRKGASV